MRSWHWQTAKRSADSRWTTSPAAREFYGSTLGLRVSDVPDNRWLMRLNLAGGREVLVYQKPDHTPASYTILNFPVQDVGAEVEELTGRGVVFQHLSLIHISEPTRR